ncbi:hypothetical protein A3H10_02945 [Candidatus Uhrbacteria bacterium RIFCSPLOWO2_12_FULL_46_10]|uniref:Uncharacterized protein n=1 Tax=Candidatus Uhrbacteria bacterium RIFCSPLOWO2_01_FULL_47_25 TaxID=1802402 RepID=A0A1F7UW36_9BACT|nr:MAG: hypothetical protein A2752_04920 [Candidatus Uhrbacteria bacterium RIFCSPHIGHO2_01_FULL_46_23]OGL68054.1 MAG: hypothetical protein A3D60_02885 [Candidatus Uhrbacteria bacterium RIFCSPHIGHO2_02_FULL_47_29]OGL76230.1 MAG: hypothetical protein A3E96_03925 [Candidatus Uhrbacteria bacterium RIFCSPHIGHO2_12_FULL_46_13]OGL82503.1 MAG: hypothetical protein A2936_03725 [Candidatus Uhrbacteria bacterium RIFCSPLOWO2_01_FULL_47_25]OGL85948.1 MAG: hypothetical protein A3I37_00230 [Candidatus Uhrbact
MTDEVTAERRALDDVIYIRDGDKPLPLHQVTINGIVVYTTDEATTRELRERFRRMVPPPDPKRPWCGCLLKWILGGY